MSPAIHSLAERYGRRIRAALIGLRRSHRPHRAIRVASRDAIAANPGRLPAFGFGADGWVVA